MSEGEFVDSHECRFWGVREARDSGLEVMGFTAEAEACLNNT
jgi:hypothetical protein